MSTQLFPFAVWLSGTNQNSIPANDNALRNEVLARAALGVADAEPSESDTDDGDVYIVGTPWGGFATDDVVIYRGGTWYGFEPFDGWLKRRLDTGDLVGYDSSDGWVVVLNDGGGTSADQISYDNAGSGLAATDVQEAIDEIAAGVSGSVDPTFLRGLRLVWVAADSIDIEPGGAYIESAGAVLDVPSKISLTGLSFSAATWYHLYLYDNSGTPAVEVSTTAPAAPFYATSRSKTGDATRRYIGSLLSDSSGTPGLWRFQSRVDGGELAVVWVTEIHVAPFELLNAGAATSPTSFSIAGKVPADVTTRCNVLLAMGIGASGEMIASVGADIPSGSNAELRAEVLARFQNVGVAKKYVYLPPASVQVIGTTLDYCINQVAGTGGDLFVYQRGYSVAR